MDSLVVVSDEKRHHCYLLIYHAAQRLVLLVDSFIELVNGDNNRKIAMVNIINPK